ncbi:hypothetical protein HD806DRAFT_369288 [Xylariaceae sp. AK1471]|nr:hypothetical protein HD806DRAFT_369288 [Xylariaceae sp. AK1471]
MYVIIALHDSHKWLTCYIEECRSSALVSGKCLARRVLCKVCLSRLLDGLSSQGRLSTGARTCWRMGPHKQRGGRSGCTSSYQRGHCQARGSVHCFKVMEQLPQARARFGDGQAGARCFVIRKIPLSVLQIEHYPYLTQPGLIKMAQENNITVTGYSTFGPQSFLELIHTGAKNIQSLRWTLSRTSPRSTARYPLKSCCAGARSETSLLSPSPIALIG